MAEQVRNVANDRDRTAVAGSIRAFDNALRAREYAYELEHAENSRLSDGISFTSSEVRLFAGADAIRVEYAYSTTAHLPVRAPSPAAPSSPVPAAPLRAAVPSPAALLCAAPSPTAATAAPGVGTNTVPDTIIQEVGKEATDNHDDHDDDGYAVLHSRVPSPSPAHLAAPRERVVRFAPVPVVREVAACRPSPQYRTPFGHLVSPGEEREYALKGTGVFWVVVLGCVTALVNTMLAVAVVCVMKHDNVKVPGGVVAWAAVSGGSSFFFLCVVSFLVSRREHRGSIAASITGSARTMWHEMGPLNNA